MLATHLFLAALLAAQAPAAGPETAPSNSLARAYATFRVLDRDADGRVSAGELGAVFDGVPGGGLRSDLDHDGLLARDEFVLAYRAFVRAQGQLAAADLDVEAARIEALRRMSLAPGAARTAAAPFATRARSSPNGEPRALVRDESAAPDPRRVRADSARDDLVRELAAGEVSRGAFERLRVLLPLDPAADRALTAFAFRARVTWFSRHASQRLELELRTWYDRVWSRDTKTAWQVAPAAPSRSR